MYNHHWMMIFDLTASEQYSDKLKALRSKKRKSYKVTEPSGNTITVNFTTDDGDSYDCVYYYREKEEIYEAIRKKQPLNLNSTYIRDFRFSETKYFRNFKLRSFNAISSFWDGNTDFDEAEFAEGKAYFNNSDFGGGAKSYSFVKFDEGANFCGVNFGSGEISFIDVNALCGGLNFRKTVFGEKPVHFSSVDFGGDADFSGADFGSGSCLIDNASFGGGNVNFYGASAKALHLSDISALPHADLRFKKIEELFIRDCIIEKTIKCNEYMDKPIRFKKLSFIDTVNLGHIYIDWEKNRVYEAVICEAAERHMNNEEKAAQFRMLKENFHTIGFYDDEDYAYRAYMKHKTGTLSRLWMKVFGLMGGYGTQAWKVLITAFLVICSFGGIFTHFFMSVETKIAFACPFFKGLYFSAITFFTIGYGDISPPDQFVAVLAGIEGFLGVFLMSYFTVSLVRKLLR